MLAAAQVAINNYMVAFAYKDILFRDLERFLASEFSTKHTFFLLI